MKKLLALIATVIMSACVSTTYEKSITVTKDANGKITGTVETERVVQPNQSGWPMKFEYIKGVQDNSSAAGGSSTTVGTGSGSGL